MSKKKQTYRFKRVVYTDTDPGLDDMIERAKRDGRVFTTYACIGIRQWLEAAGYGRPQNKPA